MYAWIGNTEISMYISNLSMPRALNSSSYRTDRRTQVQQIQSNISTERFIQNYKNKTTN